MIDASSILPGAAAPPCGMLLLPLASDAAPLPAASGASLNLFADLLALANAAPEPGASTALQALPAEAVPVLAVPELECRSPEPPASDAPAPALPPLPLLPALNTLELLVDVGTRIQALLPGNAQQPATSPALQSLQASVAPPGRTPAAQAQAAADPDIDATLGNPLLARAAASGSPDESPTIDADDETPEPESAPMPLPAPWQGLLPLPTAHAPRAPAVVGTGAQAAQSSAAPVAALASERPAPRHPARNEPLAPLGAIDRSAVAPPDLAAAAPAASTALLGKPPAPEPASAASGTAADALAPLLPNVWGATTEALLRAAGPRAEPALPFHAQLSAAIDSPAFGAALGVQISTLVAGDISQARLHLNPAELGPIAVQIGLDGQFAQVHLAVEHAATRQALEQALPELVQALHEAGFTMTGGGVSQQPREPRPDAPSPSAHGAPADPDSQATPLTQPTAARSRQGLVDVFA